MTNNQIIFNAAYQLMMDGKIGTTGRKITLDDSDELLELWEPEPIHTFNEWKKLGFIVKRGEKAIIALDIWKYAPHKRNAEEAEEEGAPRRRISNSEMIIKTAYFFSPAQVQRIGS